MVKPPVLTDSEMMASEEEARVNIDQKPPILTDDEMGQNTVYLEDQGTEYNFPSTDDEDALNYRLQTQVYGEDKNKFFMGVNTGIDILAAAGKGAVAFFPSTAMRTLAGSAKSMAERMETGPEEGIKMAARAGMYGPAIFDTVMSFAAKRTNMDETLLKASDDLLKLSNEVLNHQFFKTEGKVEQVAFDIGGAGASLLTSVGLAALTKDVKSASLLFGQIAGSDTYLRAREAGKSPKEAFQAGLINFGTEAGLEAIGLDMFTRVLHGSKTTFRIFAKATSEFLQESAQQLSTETVAKMGKFSDKEWGEIIQDTLYSGAIGFVTGGIGGAVQVVRENKGLMGEYRKAGFSDSEVEEIIMPVMERAYKNEFKQSVFNSLEREVAGMKDALNEESRRIVVDEDGNPVVLGMNELSEEEKFKYRDRQVIRYELADVYERANLGELPKATEPGTAEIPEVADPVVQARINQIEVELDELYKTVSPLMDKMEEGTLTPEEAKVYRATQKEITRREVERDEVGYEWAEDGELKEAEVEGRKVVRNTAAELYKTRMRAIKDQLRQFKEGMRSGRKVALADAKAFQTKLVEAINMSKAVTDKQKTRLLNTVKSIQTEKNMNKRIDQLDILLRKFENINGRKIYVTAIEKLLRKSVKKKLDANTRKVFDELIELNKEPALDASAFQEQYDGSIESVLRHDIALLNSLDPSLPELRQVYTDLRNVLERGVDAYTLEKRAKQQKLEADLEDINSEIAAGKGKKRVKADPNRKETKSRKRVWGIGMLVFDTLMNKLSIGTGKGEGKSIIEKRFGTYQSFLTKTKLEYYFNRSWNNAYKEAFGLTTDQQLLEKIQRDQVEEFVFNWTTETADGKSEQHSVNLTKAEMRKRWMEWQRGVGRKTLERKNMYTEELISSIENQMTEEDFRFIKAQFRIYDQLYELANPVYRKHKGVDLPYDEFYSHLFAVGGVTTEVSSVDTMAAQGGMNFFGSKLTSQDVFKRATGGSAGLRQIDDFFALQKYINDMSHFVAYADLAADIESLLLQRDTVANIKENFGEGVVKQLRHEHGRITKSATNLNAAWDGVQNFTKPLARSFLARPIVGVKQLISMFSYMDKVPTVQFVRYFSDFADPTKWPEIAKTLRHFRGDIMIQARGDVFEREIKAIRDAIQNSGDALGTDERLNINKFLLGSMRMGDRGAIYVGGYIMYKYDTEVRKISHEEAMDNFREFTNKTQQSPDMMQLSGALSDPNPVTRLMTMFTQAPVQYFNAEYRAIANWRTDGLGNTARKIFVYHFLLPTIWQLAANGLNFDKKDQAVAAILGPLSYIYFVGEGLKNFVGMVVAKTMDDENPAWREDNDAFQSYTKTVEKLVKGVLTLVEDGGLDTEDTLGLIQNLAKASAPVGGAISGAAEYGVGILKGMGHALEGDFYSAARKWIGYSDPTVERAAEE